MKNKIGSIFLIAGLIAFLSVLTYSCKKDKVVTPNQEVALFAAKGGSYLVTNTANSEFKIPVGLTAIPNADRKITFTVSSPSGAVQGQQYTLGSTSITIPAGKTVDSISLKGIFAGYPSGRRDTLIFKITGGDVPALNGSDVYTVILQKSCPLNMSDFAGDFKVLVDGWEDYAVGDVIPLTVSGNTVSFYYNVTNNANRKAITIVVDPVTLVTSVAQQTYGNYGSSATLYSVKSVPGATNVVVPCDKKITVNLNHTSAAGSYGNYTISLQKL